MPLPVAFRSVSFVLSSFSLAFEWGPVGCRGGNKGGVNLLFCCFVGVAIGCGRLDSAELWFVRKSWYGRPRGFYLRYLVLMSCVIVIGVSSSFEAL